MKGYKHKTSLAEQYEGIETSYKVISSDSAIPAVASTREHARKVKRYLESNGHSNAVIIQNPTLSNFIFIHKTSINMPKIDLNVYHTTIVLTHYKKHHQGSL